MLETTNRMRHGACAPRYLQQHHGTRCINDDWAIRVYLPYEYIRLTETAISTLNHTLVVGDQRRDRFGYRHRMSLAGGGALCSSRGLGTIPKVSSAVKGLCIARAGSILRRTRP